MTDRRLDPRLLPLVASAAAVAASIGFVVGISQSDATAQDGPAHDHEHDHAFDREHDHQHLGADGMTPEQMQAMVRWAEHAEVTEHHEWLHEGEGAWLVRSKWWWAPGAPAEESTMMAQVRPIMSGRFMLEEMSGIMDNGGQLVPWNGMAISGYDNARDRYNFVWFDNMTSSLTVGYGDKTGDGEWTYEYEAYDPMTGTQVSRRNVITEKDDGERVFDMFTKMPDGSWFRNMEMTYTRPAE